MVGIAHTLRENFTNSVPACCRSGFITVWFNSSTTGTPHWQSDFTLTLFDKKDWKFFLFFFYCFLKIEAILPQNSTPFPPMHVLQNPPFQVFQCPFCLCRCGSTTWRGTAWYPSSASAATLSWGEIFLQEKTLVSMASPCPTTPSTSPRSSCPTLPCESWGVGLNFLSRRLSLQRNMLQVGAGEKKVTSLEQINERQSKTKTCDANCRCMRAFS